MVVDDDEYGALAVSVHEIPLWWLLLVSFLLLEVGSTVAFSHSACKLDAIV